MSPLLTDWSSLVLAVQVKELKVYRNGTLFLCKINRKNKPIYMKKLITAIKTIFKAKNKVDEKTPEPVAPVKKGPLHAYRTNK